MSILKKITEVGMSLISDGDIRDFHDLGFFVTEPMWPTHDLAEMARESDRIHAGALDEASACGESQEGYGIS